MSDYNTNLKQWGDEGYDWPDNYYHIEGEAPVDAWENRFKDEVIENVQHLVDLTNSRIESAYGAATDKPSSPEDGEQYWDTDNDVLEVYDSTYGGWKDLAWGTDLRGHEADTNNPHQVTLEQARNENNTLSGGVNLGANDITEVKALKFTDRDGDGAVWQAIEGSSDGRLTVDNGSMSALELYPNGDVKMPNGTLTVDGGVTIFGNDVDVNNNNIINANEVSGADATLDFNTGTGHVNLSGGGLRVKSHQHFEDDKSLYFGSNHDFRFQYDGTADELTIVDEVNSNTRLLSIKRDSAVAFDNGISVLGNDIDRVRNVTFEDINGDGITFDISEPGGGASNLAIHSTDSNGNVTEVIDFRAGGDVRADNGDFYQQGDKVATEPWASSQFVDESGDTMTGNLNFNTTGVVTHYENPSSGHRMELNWVGNNDRLYWVPEYASETDPRWGEEFWYSWNEERWGFDHNLYVGNDLSVEGNLTEQGNRVATRTWASNQFVDESGDTMSGSLEVSGNIRTDGEFRYRADFGGTNNLILSSDNTGSTTDKWGLVHNSSEEIRFYDYDTSTEVLEMRRGGDVSVTNGNLYEQGNRVATRDWAVSTGGDTITGTLNLDDNGNNNAPNIAWLQTDYPDVHMDVYNGSLRIMDYSGPTDILTVDATNHAVNAVNGPLYEQGDRVATRPWSNDQFVNESGDTMSGNLTVNGHLEVNNGDIVKYLADGTEIEWHHDNDAGNGRDGLRVYKDGTRTWSFIHDYDSENLEISSYASGDLRLDAATYEQGDRIATRTWTNNNADVPNADHADNADQLDNLNSSQFLRSDTNDSFDAGYLRGQNGNNMTRLDRFVTGFNGVLEDSSLIPSNNFFWYADKRFNVSQTAGPAPDNNGLSRMFDERMGWSRVEWFDVDNNPIEITIDGLPNDFLRGFYLRFQSGTPDYVKVETYDYKNDIWETYTEITGNSNQEIRFHNQQSRMSQLRLTLDNQGGMGDIGVTMFAGTTEDHNIGKAWLSLDGGTVYGGVNLENTLDMRGNNIDSVNKLDVDGNVMLDYNTNFHLDAYQYLDFVNVDGDAMFTIKENNSGSTSPPYIDFHQNESHNFRLENRSSDPSSPQDGQMWLRTDL